VPVETEVTVFPSSAFESCNSYGIVARSVRVPIAPITATFTSLLAFAAGGVITERIPATKVTRTRRVAMAFLMA
jgi:hypothetical protein